MLGLEPKDYDVATDAVPEKVRALFKNTQAVGAAFGVILVRVGRSVIEVATFRSDGEYVDGRRPSEVRFTTAEEDAKRRDFTINGLFLDPTSGDVIDYVGGRADLASKTLRAIGVPDERFAEDHLRLLRAVRFAARFGLTIEPVTAAAMKRHGPQLIRISPERIADELRTMLTATTRGLAWEDLNKFGLIDVIFRFTELPVFGRSAIFWRFAPGRRVSLGEALAAAVTARFWDWSKPSGDFFRSASVRKLSQAIRKALRAANNELEDFEATLLGVGIVAGDLPPLTLSQKKRFIARRNSAASWELRCAISLETGNWVDPLRALDSDFTGLRKTDFAPLALVTGDDLTAAGLSPGPIFKRVLDAVYDEQLEGRVSGKDEALRWALEAARGTA